MAYRLTQDFLYEFGEIYQGPATKTTFSFDAPPIGYEAYAEQMIDEFRQKAEEQGASMLRIRVWEDHKPITVTPFFVEFTCCGSPITSAVIIWIIKAVIIAIIGFLIYHVLHAIETIEWPAGAELVRAIKYAAIAAGLFGAAALVRAVRAPKKLPKR